MQDVRSGMFFHEPVTFDHTAEVNAGTKAIPKLDCYAYRQRFALTFGAMR
jgi:hypothetical protein